MNNPEQIFLGIELPQNLNDSVESFQQRFQGNPNMLSFLPPHVTLVHPGCLDSVDRSAYVDAAREIISETQPTTIYVESADTFAGRVFHLKA